VFDLDENKRERLRRALTRMAKLGVQGSPEFERIKALPRRIWMTEEIEGLGGLQDLVQELTNFLKMPQGQQTLRSIQAKILQEAHDLGGLFGPVPVGDGKTLITFLAPLLLGALRPLLIVPAKLRDKTYREFTELARHWQWHGDMMVVSYEKLSREGGTEILEERQPDLLICDEVHRAKNRQAAVTRRISTWMEEHPETKVVALSGTITTRSLRDFAHILRWCLPEHLVPLPKSWRELEVWASAVDVIKAHEGRWPTDPGVLLELCNVEEREQHRDGVRSAVRRRIQETPGVVASEPSEVPASLNIILTLVEGYNEVTESHAQGLLEGVKPNGDVILETDLAARWRISRTLTSGFWYAWDPPPPPEWLSRRSAWRKAAAEVLHKHTKGLESEALVAKASDQGKLGVDMLKVYRDWLDVRGLYKPNVVPRWVDDRMIQAVAKWAGEHEGIIWVSEIALGERLEKELGLPYFHEMGKSSGGMFIEEAKPIGCIVASVASNYEGRNLQAWNDNLITTPPPIGAVWEQLIGRSYRPGQEADEVWVEVFFGCLVEWECWLQSLTDARYASKIESPKKLTYATIDKQFELPTGSGALWPVRG
jgi:hypothetical protein